MGYLNRYNLKLAVLIMVFCLSFLIIREEKAHAWSEPTIEPPGGNVAPPINVSSNPQTKLGNLTLGGQGYSPGILRLYPGNITGSPCGLNQEGQIGYDSSDEQIYYCNSNTWTALSAGATAGDFVELFTSNQGWAFLSARTSNRYAFEIKAADNLESSRGIEGISADVTGTGNWSYGVYGAAGSNDSTSYGIGGVNDYFMSYPAAYAGYFQGKVKIERGASEEAKFELASGVELCLNGVCRSAWPQGGSLWEQSDIETYLTDTNSNLVIGGDNENNSSFFTKVTDQGSFVIGQPSDLAQALGDIDSSLICGDGICQSHERNNENSNKDCGASCYNCPSDCPPFFNATFPTSVYIAPDMLVWWQSDENNYAIVYYTTDEFYQSSNQQYDFSIEPDPQNQANNGVFLGGLVSGVTYHYKVKLCDGGELHKGNCNYSEDKTFVFP